MNQRRETFFKRILQWKYNYFADGDDTVVFRAAQSALSGHLLGPTLSGAFCLITVRQGSMSLSVDYTEARLGTYSMFFLTPRMVISFRDASEDLLLEGICFSPAYFDSLSSHFTVYGRMISFLNENTMPVFIQDGDISRCFSAMADLYRSIPASSVHRDVILLHLSNLILLQSSESLHSSDSQENDKVSHKLEIYRSFRKLLSENYEKEHCIAFYANRLHISATYLSRIVRGISGRTINGHIAEMLFTEARRLLDCTDYPVKQIADILGFADQASFGKFFRGQTGISPTAYRRQISRQDSLHI